jgi:predicted GIY-YIG superfamily endonuclease
MPFWVYILKCNDASYYTGHTDNLAYRIAQHGEGKIDGYTSSRLPVTLVFAEQFVTRLEALEMERRIKGWSRKKKEAMMRGDWAEVSRLAKSRSEDAASQSVHGSTGSPRTGVNGEVN